MFNSLIMTKNLSQLQTISRAQRHDLQWVYFLLTLSATMTYLMASDEAHSEDADANTLDTLEDAEDPILLAENPTGPGDPNGEIIGETDLELEAETENNPEQGNTTENTNRDRPFMDANPIFDPAFFSTDLGTAFSLMLKSLFGTPLDLKEQQDLANILNNLGISPGTSFKDIFEPTQIFPTGDDAPPAPPSLTVDVSGPTTFNLLTAIASIPGFGAVTPAVLANILMGQPSVTIPTPFADVTIDAAGNVTIVPNAGIIPFDDGETAMTTVNIPLILPDGTIFNLPLNLNIAGMNDAPIIDQGDGPLAIIIAENQPGPALRITATDPDTNDTVMFSLQDDFGGLFVIDPKTGQISTTGLDNESMSMFELVVIASDGTATDSIKINVTVTDVNDAPVLASIGNQVLNESTNLVFTATATDQDVPANALTFSLDGGAPTGATITSGGLFSWSPTEAQGPGVYNITIRVTDDGTPNLSDFETIRVTVNEVNTAPILGLIGNQVINELSTFSFKANATDADSPANGLTFSLDSGAPSGASIDLNTGIFSWTPSEAQGPGSYTITIRVTDNGAPALSDFETINITVNEVLIPNTAPILGAIGNKTVNELAPLNFTATATDSDFPPDSLTFSLEAGVNGSVPAGANINSTTGEFSWTPTEAQGPGVYTFNVKVSDGISSDSETITVNVADVNQAPVLAAIGDKAVAELTPLNFTVLATDSDLPGDTLTFSLDPGAPAGASIDPTTGVFSWIPTDAQGPGNYNITVRVTDNGSLFDTETISVVVNEINPRILDLLAPNGDINFTGAFPPLTIQNIASQDAATLANATDFSIEGGQYRVDVSGNVPGTGSRTFQGVMANVPTTILLQLDTAQDGPDGIFNVRLGTTGADTSTVALRASDPQGNIVQGFDGEDVLFTGPGDDVLIGDGVGVTSSSDTFIYELETLFTFNTFGNDILPDFDQSTTPDQLVFKGDLGASSTNITDLFPSLLGISNNAILLTLASSVSLTLEGYKWQLSEGFLNGLTGTSIYSFGTALLPNLTSNTLQVGLDNDANGTVDETFTYFLGDNNDNAITPSIQNHLVFGFGGDDILSVGSNSFFGILIGDNFGTSLTPQGNDILEGGTKADLLIGDGDFGLTQKGNDVLFGREMDDLLFGDSFSSVIEGTSELSKNGNDVFVYSYDLDNGMDQILLFDQMSITGAQDSLGLINFPSGTLDRIETRSLPINFTASDPTGIGIPGVQINFNIVGPDDSNDPLGVNLGGASIVDLRLFELFDSGNPQSPPDPLRIPIHFSTMGDLNDFKNIPPGMADAEVFLGTDLDTYTTPEVLNGSATSDDVSAQFFFGFGGEDIVVGGSGIDYIDGGDNGDTLIGDGSVILNLQFDLGPSVLNSTDPFGNDRIFGGNGADSIYGDTLFTLSLPNTSNSVGGDDLIKGGAGDDSLTGDGTNFIIKTDIFTNYTGINIDTTGLSAREVFELIESKLEGLSIADLNTLFGRSDLTNDEIRSLYQQEDEAFGGIDRFVYDTAFDNGNDTIKDFELNKDILVITNDLGRGNPDLSLILPDFAIEDGEYVFKLLSGPFSQNFAQTVNHGTATLENITPEANSIVKTQIELTNIDPNNSGRISDLDVTLGTDGNDANTTRLNQTNVIFGLGGNDTLTPFDASESSILVGDNLFLNMGTTPAGNDTLIGGSEIDLLIGDGVQTLSDQPSGNDILFGKGGQDILIGDGQNVNPTDAKGSDVFVYDRTIDNGFEETLIRFDLKTAPTAPFDTIRIIGTSDGGLQTLAQSLTFITLDLVDAPNSYQFRIVEGGGLPLLSVNLDQTLRGSGFFTKEDNTALTATTSVKLMAEVTAGSDPTQVGTPYEVILGTNLNDTALEGGDNSNAIWGLFGNDVLVGGGTSSNSDDLLVGGIGNDELYGDGTLNNTGVGDGQTGGNDILDGGIGNDFLVGDGVVGGNNATGGNDILVGGFGENTLWGDFITPGSNVTGGDDIFVVDRRHGGGFGTPNIQDIKDFGVGNDTLRIINATEADKQGVVDILQGFTVNTTVTPFYQLLLPSSTPGNLPQDIRFTNLAVQQDTRVNFEFVTSGNHFANGEDIEVVFGTHLDDTGAFPIFGNVDANQADQIIFGFQGTNTIWGDAYNDLTAVQVEGGSLPIGILLTTQGGNDIIIGGDGNDNIGGDSGILLGTEAKGGDDFIFGGGGANTLAGDSLINTSGTDFNSLVLNGAVGGADVFLFDAMLSGLSSNSIIDFNFMNAPGKEDSIRIFNISATETGLDFSNIHDQVGFGIFNGDYVFVTAKDGMINNIVSLLNIPVPSPGGPYPRFKFEFSTDENFFTVDKTYDVILGTDGNNNSFISPFAILGTSSDEIIYGLDGEDVIFGDTDSTLSTNGSNDLIDGGNGEDGLLGDAQTIVSGGIGGNDTIFGGVDKDTLIGDSSTIESGGKGGNDSLFGEEGDDTIYGDAETNNGTGGDDILQGGEGNDTLYGDGDPTMSDPNAVGGSDTFVYDLSIDNGIDTIKDFEAGDENNPSKDKIRLLNVPDTDGVPGATIGDLLNAIDSGFIGSPFASESAKAIFLNNGAGNIVFTDFPASQNTRITVELDSATDGVDASFDVILGTELQVDPSTILGDITGSNSYGDQIIFVGNGVSATSLSATTVYGDAPQLLADGGDDVIYLNLLTGPINLIVINQQLPANIIYGDGVIPAQSNFVGGKDTFVYQAGLLEPSFPGAANSFIQDFEVVSPGSSSKDVIRLEGLGDVFSLNGSRWDSYELANAISFAIQDLGNGDRYSFGGQNFGPFNFVELTNLPITLGTVISFQLDAEKDGLGSNEDTIGVILGDNESTTGFSLAGYGDQDNILFGFNGDDELLGPHASTPGISGDDFLFGGQGKDTLEGDAFSFTNPGNTGGEDYLIGGTQNDILIGDTNAFDPVTGQTTNGATDRFVFSLAESTGGDLGEADRIEDFETFEVVGPNSSDPFSKDRILLQNVPDVDGIPGLTIGDLDSAISAVSIENGVYQFTLNNLDSGKIELTNNLIKANTRVTFELNSGINVDRFAAEATFNVVLGTDGFDILGNETLIGDKVGSPGTVYQNQIIFGLDSTDVLYGDARMFADGGRGGDDVLIGGEGVATIAGDAAEISPGTSVLSAGNDIIRGGDSTGVDELIGDVSNNQGQLVRAGNDMIFGGAGPDRIYPDVKMGNLPLLPGNNDIDGGDGVDTAFYRFGPGFGIEILFLPSPGGAVILGPGGQPHHNAKTVQIPFVFQGTDIITDVELIKFESTSAYELIVGTNTLPSESGDIIQGGIDTSTYIIGGEGEDNLYGGTILFGGNETNTLSNDILDGGDENDLLVGDIFNVGNLLAGNISETGADIIFGGDGNDMIYGDFVTLSANGQVGDTGNDTLFGGKGGDTLIGDIENNFGTITGSVGDDQLYGGPGDDSLFGDIRFNNGLVSEGGEDTLNGGPGDDLLTGDTPSVAAKDTFIFNFDSNYDGVIDEHDHFGDDRIKDFDSLDVLLFKNVPDFAGVTALDDLGIFDTVSQEAGTGFLKVEFNDFLSTSIERGSIVFENITFNPLAGNDLSDHITNTIEAESIV